MTSLRRRLPIMLIAGALGLLWGVDRTHGGALERAGAAVQENNNSPTPRDPCDDEEENFLGAILGCFLEQVFTSGNSRTTCDQVGYELEPQRLGEPYPIVPAVFTAYPYENGHPGNMADYANPPIRPRNSTKRIWIEYGTDYDDIDLVSTGLVWESASRWGLDASWRSYFENVGPAGHDDLTIGDIGVSFRLLQSTNAALRLGVAVPWVAYNGDLDAGLSLTLGSEYFPMRPWILSAEADLGQVGAASLVHLRTTLGFQIRHAELYTGVDHLSLEGEDLTVMLLGVRGWW